MSRFTTLAESIHRCHRVAKSTAYLVLVDASLYLRAGLTYSIYHQLSSWHFEQAWTASMGPTDRNISSVNSYSQNLLPICKKHSLKETPHAFCLHKDIKAAVVQAVLQEVHSCCLHSKHIYIYRTSHKSLQHGVRSWWWLNQQVLPERHRACGSYSSQWLTIGWHFIKVPHRSPRIKAHLQAYTILTNGNTVQNTS